MKAIVVTKEAGATLTQFDELEFMEGDVTFRVTHSTVNYKDGLALTGKAPVVRRFPMIAGIDGTGVVETSSHPNFKAGDEVILTGWGTGETHLGSYAQKARVKGDWLIHKPASLTPAQTMAIGTAGYTAMLCVMALEKAGLTPSKGSVLVTGANGGVGTIAISLLSSLGYHVIASTGRLEESDFLKALGASEIIHRDELSQQGKPLGKERWAGVVDSVGSHTLANALAMTKYGGSVAACGLAQGMDLPASVAPFILRGITLCGIDSVMSPLEMRQKAWTRLAADLDKSKLQNLTKTIKLENVLQAGQDIMAGKVRGRLVVEI